MQLVRTTIGILARMRIHMPPSMLRGAAAVFAGALFTVSLALAADDTSTGDDAELLAKVRASIEERLPGMPITSVTATPIEGVFELIAEGQIYYVNAEATHLLDGNLIDLDTRTNLTEARLGSLHIALINNVDESQMIIYEPEEKSDRSITVFTDISCGYCRKLHSEMDQLLSAGVRVRYLMFPRAGLDSPARQDLESVWCADDQLEAMTNAKMGGKIIKKNCENPIESHVALAEQVGLRGTPLIYLDNGQRVPGYREASVLANMVHSSDPVKN